MTSKKMIWGFLLLFLFGEALFSAEIRTGIEVEFRTFYLRNHDPNFSFQFREAKLFFDTFISDHSSALIEFSLKENQKNAQLERGYFVWRFKKAHARLKFGQMRLPFGFWDNYSISRPLIKDHFVGHDPAYPDFKLRRLDVGVQMSARRGKFTGEISVLNGNSIQTATDNNNQKDYLLRAGYRTGSLAIHLQSYFGVQQKKKEFKFLPVPDTRHIYAYGGDFGVHLNRLSISGEFASVKYSPNQSIGGYLQFNYNVLPYILGMRLIGKFEYWDPDRRIDDDEVFQSILGFKQSVSRGLTVQLEYIYNSKQIHSLANGALMEVELEL